MIGLLYYYIFLSNINLTNYINSRIILYTMKILTIIS